MDPGVLPEDFNSKSLIPTPVKPVGKPVKPTRPIIFDEEDFSPEEIKELSGEGLGDDEGLNTDEINYIMKKYRDRGSNSHLSSIGRQ